MKLDKSNKTLIFLVALMLINALAYGTIIPLLYPFAERFGISHVGISLLFASFSLFQFIATPIMGRLSDQYGRRPLLLISLFGTGVSLIMFGLAQAVWQLFVARIIDGITGGNISVAQAVIADTTKGPERAKAFGMLGASFGFGFLLGPAIGGFISSQFGLSAPFIFAGALGMIASVLGYFFLEESLPEKVRTLERKEPLFNLKEMVTTLKKPVVGMLILVSLTVSLAFNAFILGSQSMTNDVLALSTLQIGIFFSVTGLLNIIMQAAGVSFLIKVLKTKPTVITVSLFVAAIFGVLLFFAHTIYPFMILSFIFFLSSAPLMPLLSGLLSESVHPDEQGVVLGINQSYVSLGQIIGPILAGAVIGFSPSLVYVVCGILLAVGFWIIFSHERQIARIEQKQ